MKKTKNTLLICNGIAEKKEFLAAQAQNAFVICADGGANTAFKTGITPDVVIGDLDSVTAQTKAHFLKRGVKFIFVDNQNNTDLEKALDFIKQQKIKNAALVCATGGRLDFTISNLMLLFKYTADINITLKGPGWEVRPITKTTVFNCAPNCRMSIIPNTECAGVTLSGLKYPLNNATLKTNDPQLSNETKGRRFKVKFNKGNMLVYLENGQAA